MENYFKKLSAINVKGMAEKKGNFNYLSWANAWALIKENYPNAQRKVYESEQTELPYFTDGKTASVKVVFCPSMGSIPIGVSSSISGKLMLLQGD